MTFSTSSKLCLLQMSTPFMSASGQAHCFRASHASLPASHRAAFGSTYMTAPWREGILCAPGYAPDLDLVAVAPGALPYAWDERTGLSQRIIPGQPGGMFTLTGLAHDERSKVAYASDVHQRSSKMRSRKLAVLQQMLQPPVVNGDPEGGDLLVVGWGSTKGAIDEAVERARRLGLPVSSLHLRFLSPMEPGLQEIFRRFRGVMTVELNYSDEPGDPFERGWF